MLIYSPTETPEEINDLGWDEAFKISKTKSAMYWLLSMKSKKIHIVKINLWYHAKKEQENYKLKEINGISINQTIYNFNHFWNAVRYAHMSHAINY